SSVRVTTWRSVASSCASSSTRNVAPQSDKTRNPARPRGQVPGGAARPSERPTRASSGDGFGSRGFGSSSAGGRRGVSRRYGVGGVHRDALLQASDVLVAHDPANQGEQREVLAQTDVLAGGQGHPYLAHQDGTGV